MYFILIGLQPNEITKFIISEIFLFIYFTSVTVKLFGLTSYCICACLVPIELEV